MALSTRVARAAVKGFLRSRVLATGSSSAAAGTSLCVGCSSHESSMLGAPISAANASHSSMARSGSASRRSLGVSSCSAAVRILSFIGFGRKAPAHVPPPAGVAGAAAGAGLLLGDGMREPLVAERENEERRDDEREYRGIRPDRHPVVPARHAVAVGDDAGGGEADEHPDAVSGQRDQTLCGGLPLLPGTGVGVDLAGDEEEVV